MSLIQKRLQPVKARQQRLWIVHCAAWGLLVGAAAALLYGFAQLGLGHSPSANVMLGFIAVCPVIGGLSAIIRRRDFHQAAVAVDAHYRLKDRAATALAFGKKNDQTVLHQLQLADAERQLVSIDAKAVAPWKTPRQAHWAAVLTVASLALLAVTLPSSVVDASPVTNDVVLAQASRVADQIELLREHNEEEPNPELEQLIETLAAKVEELQQPGVDPKEALAKLSEMQAALQEQQKSLEQASAEVSLMAVGDALSNSGSLSAAGSALAAGNYAKASEELDKVEQVPLLDRQTNKTVTEKLDKAREKMDAVKLKNLSEAVDNLSQGLGSGDGPKFSDGSKSLSGEAKKQGRRKKLSDLLRKQNKSLEECKGECEGECQSEGNRPGGSNWGRAKSGNEPGDKTAALNSPKTLQLTGQEGDQGDVETETSNSPDRRERAQRGYRERFDQSQKLNDSVLDTELIPLGHRQTIRRYFEMIRPQQSEMDQVKEKDESSNATEASKAEAAQ